MTKSEATTAFKMIFGHMRDSDIQALVAASKEIGQANMNHGLSAQLEANSKASAAMDTAIGHLPNYVFDLINQYA